MKEIFQIFTNTHRKPPVRQSHMRRRRGQNYFVGSYLQWRILDFTIQNILMTLSMLQDSCSWPCNLDLVYGMQSWTLKSLAVSNFLLCQLLPSMTETSYVIPKSWIRHYVDLPSTEFRIRECNDYFREKPIIVDIKLSDIQGKGGWSLNDYLFVKLFHPFFDLDIMLQSKLRVSLKLQCSNLDYCKLRCCNLDFLVLQNYDDKI